VAWYALFAREFRKALVVADRAHALLPDNLAIETNRAHALMFLGRGKESKALYLAYKGKPLSKQDAKLWERVIAEDFAELRKAGLRRPMMAEIEKELGVSSSRQRRRDESELCIGEREHAPLISSARDAFAPFIAAD
jgi:predicted Zn-dependent protease